MENHPPQNGIGREVSNQPTRKFSVLSLVFIIVTLLLFSSVFFAYQNMQLRKQLELLQSDSLSIIDVTTEQTATASVSQKQMGNNWRIYDGPGLSFQYPNSWPDPKIENEGATQILDFYGTMSVEAGTLYSNPLKRLLTYDEYVKSITPVEGSIIVPTTVGGRAGVRYNEKDFDGNMMIKIVLPDPNDKNFIYTITYYPHEPEWNVAADLAAETLDPILATFQFKN